MSVSLIRSASRYRNGWILCGIGTTGRAELVEAGQAARSICDGLEHERAEIVFPARMALLMKAARLVPNRAWTALWKSASLP